MSFERGEAGKSAQDKYEEKLKKADERRLERFGPKIGNFINAIAPESEDMKAWKKGAAGERAIGHRLEKLCVKFGYQVLHDRKIPRSTANIDHILIADRGIFVIDAKNYEGLVRVESLGGIFTERRHELHVGRRNQTKLVDGVKKQVEVVRHVLSEDHPTIPVYGLLAFYGAEWPALFKPREIDGILLNSKGTKAALHSKPEFPGINTDSLTEILASRFPSK